MKALAILNQVPASKEGIELFVKAIVHNMMEGEIEPLSIRMRVDAVERIMKGIKADDSFQDAVLDHADNFTEKSFDFDGVKFTKTESAQYDYSEDQEWNELKAIEEHAIMQRKAREVVLKSLKEATEINGVTCYPPSKRSKSIVKVTF